MTIEGRALGRLQHDPIAVASVPQHYAAVMPKPALDRSHIPFTPGLYDNDWAPNCTAVALANAARGASWSAAGCDLVVDPAKPLAFYAECVNVPDEKPAILATDGAVGLAVLGQADRLGFDIGPQSLVPAWRRCRVGDRFAMADAIDSQALYLGVGLALADQAYTTWDTATPGDQTCGSWGGHMVFGWDYTGLGDTDIVRIGTWGGWQKVTWRWVDARAREIYAITFRQIGAA